MLLISEPLWTKKGTDHSDPILPEKWKNLEKEKWEMRKLETIKKKGDGSSWWWELSEEAANLITCDWYFRRGQMKKDDWHPHNYSTRFASNLWYPVSF